jgi:hypothetical protein
VGAAATDLLKASRDGSVQSFVDVQFLLETIKRGGATDDCRSERSPPRSTNEIGFVLQKDHEPHEPTVGKALHGDFAQFSAIDCLGPPSPVNYLDFFGRWRFAQPHARAAAVLVDEFDAARSSASRIT